MKSPVGVFDPEGQAQPGSAHGSAATGLTQAEPRLRRAFVRASILALGKVKGLPFARRGPLSLPIRWLNNHYAPWAARSVFVDALHRVNGVVMAVPRAPRWGGGGEFHMALGTYERAELDYVLHHLQAGDAFIDAGAHVGYFSLPAAKRVGPTGRVIAIEPTPAALQMLQRNIELNHMEWIKVIGAAASDHDGRAVLRVNSWSPMWNSLTMHVGASVEGGVPVPTIALDSVLAAEGWPRVAGIKLDVEGVENAVLRGARETLARNPGAFVIFELSGLDPDRREVSAEALQILESHNYRFRRLQEGGASGLLAARDLLPSVDRTTKWQESLLNVVAVRT